MSQLNVRTVFQLVALIDELGIYKAIQSCNNYYVYETLDHLPSSCIVAMVHVVKGRQYSAYTVSVPRHAGT